MEAEIMRMFDLFYEDYFRMKRVEILDTIRNTEGRTLMCETIISTFPLLDGVSNPETAAAFSADMITLNTFNFDAPFIFGYGDDRTSPYLGIPTYANALEHIVQENLLNPDYIQEFKKIIGRFIGVNLEPVPEGSNYPEGLRCNEKNLKKAKAYGFDYVVITANPSTGVTSQGILEGILLARRILGEDTLIVAGKMHGAGAGNIYDLETVKGFITAGADIILLPAPGTVPGFTVDLVKGFIDMIHEEGALALTTIGTSQEGSTESFIESIAQMAKMAGADIQHTGDAGVSGMTPPENILRLSITIRGRRHTYRRMARSSRR